MREGVPPGGGSSYPDFEPHITLASLHKHSKNDLSKVVKALGDLSQVCIMLHFESIHFRNEYVAIGVKSATTSLSNLRDELHENLHIDSEPNRFSPHLSLAYIDEKGNQEKNAYVNRLRKLGRLQGTTHVTLDGGGHGLGVSGLWLSHFIGSEIWIMEWKGIDDHKVLKRLPIG